MIKKVIAKAIEVDPDSVWLLTGPGQLQSGSDFAKALAGQGRAVTFLRWPGGNTIAVTYPAAQGKPHIHQLAQAFRSSMEVPHL